MKVTCNNSLLVGVKEQVNPLRRLCTSMLIPSHYGTTKYIVFKLVHKYLLTSSSSSSSYTNILINNFSSKIMFSPLLTEKYLIPSWPLCVRYVKKNYLHKQ
jgi:hypothetical protein